MSHFNVSLIVWAKSQDSVHKPQFFFKRKESRSGSNRGPSAYQPSALPLGHTGSRKKKKKKQKKKKKKKGEEEEEEEKKKKNKKKKKKRHLAYKDD